MVPETTVLIIGDDDHDVFRVRSIQHIVDELNSVVLPEGYIGITGMFVVDAQGFYKANAREGPGLGGCYK